MRFEILLDEPLTVYAPGRTIRGAVLWDAERAGRCAGLSIVNEYRVHRADNRDPGEFHADRHGRHELFSGEFEAGERRFPFAIELPEGPLSFDGQLFAVEWLLEARTDVGLGRDLHASLVYRLESARGKRASKPRFGAKDLVADLDSSNPGCAILGGAFGGLILAVLIFLIRNSSRLDGTAFTVLGGLAFFAAAVAGVAALRLAGGRRKGSELRFNARDLGCGDELRVALRWTPPAPAGELKAVAHLRCVERYDPPGPHNAVDKVVLELARETELGPGKPGNAVSTTLSWKIPQHAASSFEDSVAAIAWSLSFALKADEATVYAEDFELNVRP